MIRKKALNLFEMLNLNVYLGQIDIETLLKGLYFLNSYLGKRNEKLDAIIFGRTIRI